MMVNFSQIMSIPSPGFTLSCLFGALLETATFIPSIYYATVNLDDSCQDPSAVHIPLSHVLIISATVDMATWLISAIISFFHIYAAIGSMVLLSFSSLAFEIVLAVSLFSDSMNCVPNGLWVMSVIKFGFFVIACCRKGHTASTFDESKV
jgi:hypothetical protein